MEEEAVARTFTMPKDIDDFVREEAAARGNAISAMYRQIVFEWMKNKLMQRREVEKSYE